MISKVTTTTLPNGKQVNYVTSESIKFGTSGIVDKVVLMGIVKIVVNVKFAYEKKIPGIGDKFSTRTGQKGMWYGFRTKDIPFTRMV